MRLIEFTTTEKCSDGRPYKVCFPVSEIKKIMTIHGSGNVYLVVNDISVLGSYDKLLEILSKELIEVEESIFTENFKVYDE